MGGGESPKRKTHGLAPVPGFLGHLEGSNHPILKVLLGQVGVPPISTRPRFVHKVQRLPFRLQFPDHLGDVTLARADRAQEHGPPPRAPRPHTPLRSSPDGHPRPVNSVLAPCPG